MGSFNAYILRTSTNYWLLITEMTIFIFDLFLYKLSKSVAKAMQDNLRHLHQKDIRRPSLSTSQTHPIWENFDPIFSHPNVIFMRPGGTHYTRAKNKIPRLPFYLFTGNENAESYGVELLSLNTTLQKIFIFHPPLIKLIRF